MNTDIAFAIALANHIGCLEKRERLAMKTPGHDPVPGSTMILAARLHLESLPRDVVAGAAVSMQNSPVSGAVLDDEMIRRLFAED